MGLKDIRHMSILVKVMKASHQIIELNLKRNRFGEYTLSTYFSLQAALCIICEACKQRTRKELEEIK